MIGLVNRSTSIIPLFRLFSSLHDHKKVVMLTSAIDTIYNDEWRVRGVLPFRKDNLQMDLLVKEDFILDPINYYQYKQSDIPNLFYKMLLTEAKLGYIWLNEWVDSDGAHIIGVYNCRNPVDLLLLTALSRVIITTLFEYDDMPHLFKFKDLKAQHYAFLNRQQNVVKVVKLEFRECMGHILKSRIYHTLDIIPCQGILLKLIKQVIYLPVYHHKTDQILHLKGITPIGEITQVLMHYFLAYVLDMAIEKKFPGITYSRWGTEVFLVFKEGDSFSFNEEVIDLLLEEIDLKKQTSIGWLCKDSFYCLPACNDEKALIIHEDGDLSVWKYEDI